MRYLPLPASVFPKITVITTLLVIGLAWGSWHDPETFWAPGDLSAHHAAIGRCSACHEAFDGPRREKCVGCHRGSEFRLPSMTDHKICLACHTEHRGRLAQITSGSVGNPHAE
jgi:hypothetical protein